MNDITTRKDIELLVNRFYDRVRLDPVIGPIFNDVAKVSWEEHLPKMYRFWETVLLGKATFKGNPMATHIKLGRRTDMNSKQFNRWLALWNETLDTHFSGDNATEAKARAKNIAGLMQYKIENDSINS